LVGSEKAEDRAALERLRGAVVTWIREVGDEAVRVE
jgi:hypothetical protein